MNKYKLGTKSPKTKKDYTYRELLEKTGAANLSDHELLMVLLGTGIQGLPLDLLALKVLTFMDETNLNIMDSSVLQKLPGIGQAKACQIEAAYEFFRRRLKPADQAIKTPQEAYDVFKHYANRNKETFVAACLNGAHEVLDLSVVSMGTINKTIVHPREVFSEAIEKKAAAIIVGHNHPSGNLTPSPEDHEVTSRLKEAGSLLGIPLLDHLVFTTKSFISFNQKGWL